MSLHHLKERDFTLFELIQSWMNGYKNPSYLKIIGKVLTLFDDQTTHQEHLSLLKEVEQVLPLHPISVVAILSEHLPVLQALTSHGFDFVHSHDQGMQERNYYNDDLGKLIFYDTSPLFAAVVANKVKALSWLLPNADLSQGISVPNIKLNEGHQTLSPPEKLSPLAWALHYESQACAELLLQNAVSHQNQLALDQALFLLIESNRGERIEFTFFQSWLEKLMHEGANPHTAFSIDTSNFTRQWFFGSLDGLDSERFPKWNFYNELQHRSGVAYCLYGYHEFERNYSKKSQTLMTFTAAQRLGSSVLFTEYAPDLIGKQFSQQFWQHATSKSFQNFAQSFLQQLHQSLSDSGYHTSPANQLHSSMINFDIWKKYASANWLEPTDSDKPFCVWLDLVGLQARIDGDNYLQGPEYPVLNEQVSELIEALMETLPLTPNIIRSSFQRIIKTSTHPFDGPVVVGILKNFNDDQTSSFNALKQSYQLIEQDLQKARHQSNGLISDEVKRLNEQKKLYLEQLPEVAFNLLSTPTVAKKRSLRL